MPYAYTLSGSIKKFESDLWSGSSNTYGTVSTPDSSTGEYTITAKTGYKISSTGTYTLTTNYGGVEYTEHFTNGTTTISIKTNITSSGVGIKVSIIVSGNDALSTSENIVVRVEITASNPLSLIDLVIFTITKTEGTQSQSLDVKMETNRIYYAKIRFVSPTSGDGWVVSYTKS